MKKGILVIVILASLAAYLIYSQSAVLNKPSITTAIPELKTVITKHEIKQPLATSALDKVKKIQQEVKQCTDSAGNFGARVNDIHQHIRLALQKELADETSIKRLLSYSDLYTAFYKSYDDLLREAIISEQRTHYNFAHSAAILTQWQGIEVIKGFSKEKITMVVEQLNLLKNAPGLSITLSLADTIKKESLYALLNNTDNFTTYFKSPFHVQSSPAISPSILFTLNAEKLPLNEFKQAITNNNFTVNELAIAIDEGINSDYIIALMQQVSSINDMPIFGHKENTVFFNLADLAVSKFNLPVLKALIKKGVTPTNDQDLTTPLDIAIDSLPKSGNLTLAELTNTHKDMLAFLVAAGYKAQGEFSNHDGIGKSLLFDSHFNTLQGAFITARSQPEIYQYFSDFPVIGPASPPEVTESDGSFIANALTLAMQEKAKLTAQNDTCQQYKVALNKAKQLKTTEQAYDKIIQVQQEYGHDAINRLRDIDPVLVNYLWNQDASMANYANREQDNSEFITALRNNALQTVQQYSLNHVLSQTETDFLFDQLLKKPNDLIAIWNNRISAKNPTKLINLSRLNLKQWQTLMLAGFDFSLTDIHGNDAYITAALMSDDAVRFLFENNIPANPNTSGVDILDLALEQSYTNATMSPILPIALKLVKNIEPNHLARMARLKLFYPAIYEQTIKLNQSLATNELTKINHYLFNYF